MHGVQLCVARMNVLFPSKLACFALIASVKGLEENESLQMIYCLETSKNREEGKLKKNEITGSGKADLEAIK